MNPAEPNTSPNASGTPPVRLKRFLLATIFLILIGLAAGALPRWFARRALARETVELAVNSVAVVSPLPGHSDLGVPLAAGVRACVEAPIYARSSGYV